MHQSENVSEKMYQQPQVHNWTKIRLENGFGLVFWTKTKRMRDVVWKRVSKIPDREQMSKPVDEFKGHLPQISHVCGPHFIFGNFTAFSLFFLAWWAINLQEPPLHTHEH